MSCCADRATYGLPQCEPSGYISTHGAYFSPSPNINAKDEHSERAILLLTDDVLENSRILADNLALRLDCDVWVPDYYQRPRSHRYPHANLRIADGAKISACAWLKSTLRTFPRTPVFIKNRPAVIDARLCKFIKAVQEEKDYLKIGAVGYCSGGSTAIRLASTKWIQSVVVCHPREFKLPDLQTIKVPSAWVCAEEDKFFTKSLRLKAEATFRRRKFTETDIEYEFEDYRGTAHGFAYRPDLTVAETKEAYEKAFEQVVRWFSKTLPV